MKTTIAKPTSLVFATFVLCFIPIGGAEPAKEIAISPNKLSVRKYMEAFMKSDRALILSCLTDDVVWEIPGLFRTIGKGEFDDELENEAFIGGSKFSVIRMTEENNVVIVEGTVRGRKKESEFLSLAFCNVFEMQDAKIKRLTSYLAEVKE